MCFIFLHWIPANFAHSLSFLINIFSFSFFLVNLCLCLLQSDSCHPQDLQASSSITQMQPIMDPEVSKMREGGGGRREGVPFSCSHILSVLILTKRDGFEFVFKYPQSPCLPQKKDFDWISIILRSKNQVLVRIKIGKLLLVQSCAIVFVGLKEVLWGT